MPGGPYAPASAPIAVTAGKTFPMVYSGAGSTFKQIYGLGVMASVNADSIWRMGFELPITLPTGVCKLQLWALANAVTGAAKVNPKWAMVASGANPSTTTLVAETTQTITWIAADNDKLKLTSINLDATTPVGGQMLCLDLVFETLNWTLASVSCWLPYVEFV
jgi:hypothetical protein